MNKEEILKKYKLSDKFHDEIYDKIKTVWTTGKHPVNHPIAIVVGGQTGAGKTSALGYFSASHIDSNIVTINSDDIKPFHPQVKEIAENYPELFTQITDQESNTWTSRLFSELRHEGYNLIFEGTMWNNRVADDAIAEMQSLGYTVVVCGIATGELESRLSVIERYLAEIDAQGYGRLVYDDHHKRTYNGMPLTIDYIEQTGKFSVIEILTRGELGKPELIYSAQNAELAEETKAILSDKNIINLATNENKNKFECAREAVITARVDSNYNTLENFESRLMEIIDHVDETALTQIKPLLEAYERVLKENVLDSEKMIKDIKTKIRGKISDLIHKGEAFTELVDFGEELYQELLENNQKS